MLVQHYNGVCKFVNTQTLAVTDWEMCQKIVTVKVIGEQVIVVTENCIMIVKNDIEDILVKDQVIVSA